MHLAVGPVRALALSLVVSQVVAVPPPLPPGQTQPSTQQKPPVPPVPTTGTGLILGQVVDQDGAAVANAHVALTAQGLPGASALRVFTTSEGRFAFMDLPKATFTLNVTKPGYEIGRAHV